MEKSEYQRYLASREWAVLRRKVHNRSAGICERCHINEASQVHHVTYERIGRELLEDLQHVCSLCHDFLSGANTRDPINFGAEHAEIKRRCLEITREVKILETRTDVDFDSNRQIDNLFIEKTALLKRMLEIERTRETSAA